MLIHPISDLHLEHAYMPATYAPPQCDVVVLAGDICPGLHGIKWANETFEQPVIYLTGNHDFWDGTPIEEQLEILKSAAAPNVHVLNNESVVIDGVQFVCATLWTDFDIIGQADQAKIANLTKDSEYIRMGEEWFKPNLMVREHTYSKVFISEAVRNFEGKSVVVTHHAPSRLSIHPRYSPNDLTNSAYASNLENLILDLNAPLWIHGHTHDNFDYMIGDTRIVCNPRGYHGKKYGPNLDFIPDLVIEV